MSGLTDKVLLWLNDSIIQLDPTVQQTLDQLHQFIHHVYEFISPDSCVDFLTDIDQQSVFLILSYSRAQQIIHHIHPIAHLCTIYVIAEDLNHHSSTWIKDWHKITGVYPNVPSIYNDLSTAVKQNNQDLTPSSIASSFEVINNTNRDCLEPSFMYTQLFKETLLNMNHDKQSREDFISFCRERPNLTTSETRLIDEFERTYSPEHAIWWYTRESFIYHLLNQALRLLQADIIIMMGFFIADLHRQIERLHEEQRSLFHRKTMTVYRGQRLSSIDFDKLVKATNGLMSFNSFLSTSRDDQMPLVYAESAAETTDLYGILFVITVDQAENIATFADIYQSSAFPNEDEILFSMHTIFRIEQIVDCGTQHRMKRVLLTLVDEDDEQLRILSDHIRHDISGKSSTKQLSELLIQTNQPNMIDKLCRGPHAKGSDSDEIFDYYYYRSFADLLRGRHYEACLHVQQAIKMIDTNASIDFDRIASIYAMQASAYFAKGEYSKALKFHEKALEISKGNLPVPHLNLAISYGNIALVYSHMGEHLKALSFNEQALEIMETILPVYHPDFATVYGNIALVYYNKDEYSKALSLLEKALEIKKRSLPVNHPNIATSYANIATVYYNVGEYSKALSFNEQALEIMEKSLPANHPNLAISYGNIGSVHYKMSEYLKALSFQEQALEIEKKSLPVHHPNIATSYANIATMYTHMGEYSKALSFQEQALEIMEKSLPANHPTLGISYDSIAVIYNKMGEYSKAKSFLEKSLEIMEKILPDNHLHLVTSYLNLGALNLIIGLRDYPDELLTKVLSASRTS